MTNNCILVKNNKEMENLENLNNITEDTKHTCRYEYHENIAKKDSQSST